MASLSLTSDVEASVEPITGSPPIGAPKGVSRYPWGVSRYQSPIYISPTGFPFDSDAPPVPLVVEVGQQR